VNILFLTFLLWLTDNRSLEAVSRSNEARKKGQLAYKNADYSEAVLAYRTVLSASMFTQPEVRLNLAHAYFQQKQWQNAQRYYSQLAAVRQPVLASRAQMQLGIIHALRRDTLSALRFFQKSLITNPENRLAAYNYEVLKKQYHGATPPPVPPSKNSTTPPPPTQKTANEVQKSEERKVQLQRFQGIKMTEAQALLLLDALKNAEVQYLQQQKRKVSPNAERGKW
jgi:tetratricopeptide (TPR) repeat protein